MLDIARDRRKTLKIGKEKRKARKDQTTILNIFFTFTFFVQKNLYCVRKYIWKNLIFILLHFYCSFFAWQVIGNGVTKHQGKYALVLQTLYFGQKYLAIDCGIIFQTIYTSQKYIHSLERNCKNSVSIVVKNFANLDIHFYTSRPSSIKQKLAYNFPCEKFNFSLIHSTHHCVKSVRIRSYSGPHFSRIFPHSD